MRLCKSEEGFSLIEVVIALGVLGIGILSMYSMQLHSIKGNSSANKITQEAVWGADGLEQIYSFDFDEIIDASGERPDLEDYVDTDLFDIAWTTTEDSPLEDVATIEIKITSKLDGKAVTLQYLKADPGAF